MRRTTNSTTTFLVILLVALGQFAIDIYLPSLPAMVRVFQTDKSIIQLTLTVFLITFALSQLIYGALSERFGRRRVLFVGLAIFIAGALWSTFANSITALLISRAVQGAGIGAANVLCRAILRDLYSGKELAKKVSYLGLVWVMSPIIAPVLGGYFEQYFGWRMNFIFLAIFVAIILFWAVIKLPETKNLSQLHSIHPKIIANHYRTILKNRFCMGYILADFILYGVFSAFYVAGPFLLQNRLKLSPIAFGWMMLIISTGYFLGSFTNSRLIHHFSIKKVIYLGLGIVCLSSLAMLIFALSDVMNVEVIVAPLCFLFLGMGLIFTNCISGCLSIFPHLAGHTSAIWGFFAFVGGTVTTFLMSLFQEQTQIPLSWMLLIQSILVVVTLTVMVFRKPNSVKN